MVRVSLTATVEKLADCKRRVVDSEELAESDNHVDVVVEELLPIRLVMGVGYDEREVVLLVALLLLLALPV